MLLSKLLKVANHIIIIIIESEHFFFLRIKCASIIFLDNFVLDQTICLKYVNHIFKKHMHALIG